MGHESACQVTVRHRLAFSLGLAWRETYKGESPTASPGDTNILAAIARKVLEPVAGERYPWTLLL